MTLRAASLALLAWVAALVLPAAACAQYANLSVEPIDISTLVRMLREETGTEPADWDAFERIHALYVGQHAPLVERACRAINSTEGNMDRQRGPSIELQLAQQDLDAAMFATVASLLPPHAAEGIEQVRVLRELAVMARMGGWLGQVISIDAATSLQRVLRDDPDRWTELKPEVDRHRRGRRDLLRRMMRAISEAMECSDRSAPEQEAIWAEYRDLTEGIQRLVDGGDPPVDGDASATGSLNAAEASGAADGAGGQAEGESHDARMDMLQHEQQALLRKVAALHNGCWQAITAATAAVVDHDVAFHAALAPRLAPLQRLAWRRSVAAELGVPTDRSHGLEQLALALLRAPGADQPLRERVLDALRQWADQDGAVQEAMFRGQGARIAQQFLMLQWEDGEPPAAREFEVRSQERELRADRAREQLQSMVAAQLGDEAVAEGVGALEQGAPDGQQPEFVLGEDPETPEVDAGPGEAPDETGVPGRARPTLGLLDRFIDACSIPDAQAESMRALLASHESIVASISQGELAAVRGQEQHELMQRVATMPFAEAVAAVEAYVLRVSASESRIHAADDAFWTALGELSADLVPDLVPAMRVSAGLASADQEWASVTSPSRGDPVRVAIGCLGSAEQVQPALAVAAAVESSVASIRTEVCQLQSALGFEWLRGSLLWRVRGDVADEERAAIGEANRLRQAELFERFRRAQDRRDELQRSLARDLASVIGPKGAWRFQLALAAQAAPNGFRDRQRLMPVLDALLGDAELPGGVRADVLGLKDDLEPELRGAEERLIESMDAITGSRVGTEDWIDRSSRAHRALWTWWLRDEVERRAAERLRRLVPASILPDSALRPIRHVERGRYGM